MNRGHLTCIRINWAAVETETAHLEEEKIPTHSPIQVALSGQSGTVSLSVLSLDQLLMSSQKPSLATGWKSHASDNIAVGNEQGKRATKQISPKVLLNLLSIYLLNWGWGCCKALLRKYDKNIFNCGIIVTCLVTRLYTFVFSSDKYSLFCTTNTSKGLTI